MQSRGDCHAAKGTRINIVFRLEISGSILFYDIWQQWRYTAENFPIGFVLSHDLIQKVCNFLGSCSKQASSSDRTRVAHGLANEDQQRQHDRDHQKAGEAVAKALPNSTFLQQKFAERR